MNEKVKVSTQALDQLVTVLDRLGVAADKAVSDKNQCIHGVLNRLQQRKFEIDQSENKWTQVYEDAVKHLYDTDEDGHKTINPERLRMKQEAEKNIQLCKSLRKAVSMHQTMLDQRAQTKVLYRYRTDCQSAAAYISQLRQHIADYGATDNFPAYSFAWAGSAHQTGASETGMALAQGSSLQESFFEDRKVLQRDIDWKFVPAKIDGKANFLTNWELANRGRAPYDREGGQIQLHHINQEYDETLVEVPNLYHKSHEYNLHEGSVHPDSFRNDADLGQEFDDFRKNYWINRANKR